eukprot:CAMPEP_0203684488 /NCGR_PEP_ID=MMETSP0090-20130426/48058_1 /ASSEMBLY_ACC=CAM_ASM_001088 /TAXON_ID=426623 /ORGANISM="Chaetoceros affinis, Strain CCMP159" /LENGTH=543 /DNA_ID=CAMNT_0050553663 /DNA_START=110 /DNA_END=1744 /DNA_ORIENTATION=-
MVSSPMCSAFQSTRYWMNNRALKFDLRTRSLCTFEHQPLTSLHVRGNGGDDPLEQEEEETRLKVLNSRRKIIRSTLRSAESQKIYRIANDLVPEIDEETGKPVKPDSKLAITLSAFVVAAGAVTLRVGGRAALVSGLGLDFATGNPELKENMDQFLNFASSLGDGTEALLFVLAWTAVKVFCFDAGGVVLALSSGILFGGVLQGALFSAFAATVGSSVAYYLAKVDSPIRKKALEIVDEYPSLRGIEKVVAEEGLKAVLTLRLAPILPGVPIGVYNYIYGVTNVPFWSFVGGIFFGSLKPYLLDSYLGYFGKEVIDGNLSNGDSLQDIILLVVLGVSVLIGVFASQLAGETWESVTEEIEAEKRKKKETQTSDEIDDKITRSVFGFELPEWVVGAQISLNEAQQRMDEMIETEYRAAVWNCTDDNPPERSIDPANYQNSPEVLGRGNGFDAVASICDGLVLSPSLIKAYFTYSDPLYDEDTNADVATETLDQKKPHNASSDYPDTARTDVKRKTDNLHKSLQILRDGVNVKLQRIEKDLLDLQ